jgi:hypothetical protein
MTFGLKRHRVEAGVPEACRQSLAGADHLTILHAI